MTPCAWVKVAAAAITISRKSRRAVRCIEHSIGFKERFVKKSLESEAFNLIKHIENDRSG
jgi:hypothetical protein